MVVLVTVLRVVSIAIVVLLPLTSSYVLLGLIDVTSSYVWSDMGVKGLGSK